MVIGQGGLREVATRRIILGSIIILVVAVSILVLPAARYGREAEFVIHPHEKPLVFAVSVKDIDVVANAPQYSLPINLSEVEYLGQIIGMFSEVFGYDLDGSALEKLSLNSFVVFSIPPSAPNWRLLMEFEAFYKLLSAERIPVFITTDAILHIYHVLYMGILRKIEERYLVAWLDNLLSALIGYMRGLHDEYPNDNLIRESAQDVLAYLCVAKKLLNPTYDAPSYVADVVDREIGLILDADQVSISPLFGYPIDYTLFRPRGYYTSSEKLSRYFRAMMWLGYAYFDINNITRTLEAMLLTIALNNAETDINGSKIPVRDLWEKIYTITAFFVGFSDDLTIYDYEEAIYEVYGARLSIRDLKNTTRIQEVMEILREKDRSRILTYGERRPGLRFMGQRFVPDSYILQSLVDPYVPNRILPRGLDVMAVLGSNRARLYLSLDLDQYPGYSDKLDELKREFDLLSAGNWTQNLYWGWLYTIKAALISDYEGYPTFMRTDAWLDEKLTTALGSWTELRHDTILYTKQSSSFTMIETIKGYVEPMVGVYNRLLALCNATIIGLKEFGLLQEYIQLIEGFEAALRRLLEISIKELKGITLNESDYSFISGFGDAILSMLGRIEDAQSKTPLIADVHTAYGPEGILVLEEANGVIEPIIIIYMEPDGHLTAAVGGVFSYYEFVSSTRLTDEEWTDMLLNDAPERPQWISSYHA